MEIDFTPTAFTVKDPGNGNARRYDHDTQVAAAGIQAGDRGVAGGHGAGGPGSLRPGLLPGG